VDAASVVFKMGEDKVLDVKDHIVKMSLSWDFFDGMKPVNMDAACVCFDTDGKFLDTCFYNRLGICDGSITHSGDSRDGKKKTAGTSR
jgi:stress response protein SCP2